MAKRLDASRIETRLIPIDAIDDHPENYNIHPDAQIVSLSKSHDEFGQYRSIVVWARPGGKYVRVVGHGYSKGAKQAAETMLRCEVLPEDTPPETVKAIMLADNLHAQNSTQDDELLAALLSEQKNAGFDLASLGSDDETLRDMLAKMTPPTLDELTEQYGDEPEDDAFWPVIRVKVSPETKELYDSLMEEAEGTDESIKFAWLLERVNVAVEGDEE